MPDSTDPQQVSLYTFVSNTPAPVVRLLTELAPLISFARRVAQIVSWQSESAAESWLALALWWATCLWLNFALRYLLPAVILVPIAVKSLAPRFPFLRRFTVRVVQPPPSTETAISQTLVDVHIIQGLLPHIPQLPDLPPTKNVVRIVGIVHGPYVAIVHLISVKVLVAILGTVLLTWRSSWATTSRRVLLRSGLVQWGIRQTWIKLSGLPPSSAPFGAAAGQQQALTSAPRTIISAKIPADTDYELPVPAHLRFRFTIYENQRWWMGLDFTAALLPGDRPSWCSPPPSMSPLPPPGSLSLPGPTTVFLPLTDSTGAPLTSGMRMKRSTKWRWEESEWGVTVRTTAKDGSVHEDRVRMEPPTETDSPGGMAGGAGAGARLVDAVGKGLRRAQTASGDHGNGHGLGSPIREDSIFHRFTTSDSHGSISSLALPSDTDLTDSEGWVYADNKWEGGSGVRGRGKYTRYRRWTRVAVLEETIEVVDAPGATLPGTPQEYTEPEPTLLPSRMPDSREPSPLRRRMIPT